VANEDDNARPSRCYGFVDVGIFVSILAVGLSALGRTRTCDFLIRSPIPGARYGGMRCETLSEKGFIA
jgi:hypothetical protein